MGDFFNNIEKYIASVLFIAFSTIMIINVFMRFALNSSIPWASELVLTIFVWFVWISISYAFKEDTHIRVTVILDLFPQKVKSIIVFLTNVLVLVFMAVMLKASIELVSGDIVQNETSLLLNYPRSWFYSSSIVGITLSIIRIVQNLIKEYKKEVKA